MRNMQLLNRLWANQKATFLLSVIDINKWANATEQMKYLIIFAISMLPIVELRGAIPVARALNLPLVPSYLICIFGNILVVPFLLLFGAKLLQWLTKIPKIGTFFQRIIDKADVQAKKIANYEFIGLLLFVGVPLPGTGAWTGCVVATFLRMKFRKALLAVSLGVLLSGCIMALLSYGVFDFILNLFR